MIRTEGVGGQVEMPSIIASTTLPQANKWGEWGNYALQLKQPWTNSTTLDLRDHRVQHYVKAEKQPERQNFFPYLSGHFDPFPETEVADQIDGKEAQDQLPLDHSRPLNSFSVLQGQNAIAADIKSFRE